MTHLKILNLDMLAEVESIKPGLAAKLLDTFLGYAPGRHTLCREGLASGDWKTVESAAHSLKSSAGHLGAEMLLDICARLEDAAENGDAAAASGMAGEFESVYAGTLAALERERAAWTRNGN